jgi:SAM-dependent methyltransferase
MDNAPNTTTTGSTPVETMLQMMSGFWVSRGIWIAAKLGIPDLLKDGSKTAAELAEATGMNADSVFRVLRMLAMVGIFGKDGDRFTQTPLSETLRSDVPGSLRYGAVAELGEIHYEAWGNIMHSMKTGEIAFDKKFGMNAWQYFETDPEKAQNFNTYMASNSAMVSQAIINAYDFSNAKRVFDIGGGLGSMLAEILKANPDLHGAVFDAPSVVEKSRGFLDEAGVGDRAEVVGGDFFESVPAGGDIYTMRWIIHDWDDELSVKIFRNIRKVIPENGRLLLFEAVVPEEDQPHFSKFMDLIMLTMTGGRERTAAEYSSLLEKGGFRMTRVVPTESFMGIVEAVPI